MEVGCSHSRFFLFLLILILFVCLYIYVEVRSFAFECESYLLSESMLTTRQAHPAAASSPREMRVVLWSTPSPAGVPQLRQHQHEIDVVGSPSSRVSFVSSWPPLGPRTSILVLFCTLDKHPDLQHCGIDHTGKRWSTVDPRHHDQRHRHHAPMTLLEDTTLTWLTAAPCTHHGPCQTSASVILFHMVLDRPQLVSFSDEEQNILRRFNP